MHVAHANRGGVSRPGPHGGLHVQHSAGIDGDVIASRQAHLMTRGHAHRYRFATRIVPVVIWLAQEAVRGVHIGYTFGRE